MLRAGQKIRFTPREVEQYRLLGIDISEVRTQDDVEQALTQWASTLSEQRPDLLEKIALALAQAKGVKPPVRLTVVVNEGVPASGCPRQP